MHWFDFNDYSVVTPGPGMPKVPKTTDPKLKDDNNYDGVPSARRGHRRLHQRRSFHQQDTASHNSQARKLWSTHPLRPPSADTARPRALDP